jgi:hypothetical protein
MDEWEHKKAASCESGLLDKRVSEDKRNYRVVISKI